LCGEIWPLPVPVLPAFVYWLLPVPGPPGWFRFLSSVRSLEEPGLPVPPCCWVVDWLPPLCELLPDWAPRFICEVLPVCALLPVPELLPDWFSRLPEVLPRVSESFAIGLLLKCRPCTSYAHVAAAVLEMP